MKPNLKLTVKLKLNREFILVGKSALVREISNNDRFTVQSTALSLRTPHKTIAICYSH